MMALAKCISHTKNSLGYGWNEEKNSVVVYRNNIIGENPEEITREFKLLQDQNYQCANNTISVVLSLSTKNKIEVDDNRWNLIINEFITEMKLQDHQAIAFKHQDKKHLHCHLYINRIKADGRAYSSSYIGYKSGLVADKISEKYGLARPMEMKKNKERDSKEIRNEILQIHNRAIRSLQVKSYDNYIKLMALNEIIVKAVKSKNGNLNGFRYYYKQQNFKASEIHRSMSLNNLHQALYNINEGWPEIKEMQQKILQNTNNQNENFEFTGLLDAVCELLRSTGHDKAPALQNEEWKRKKKKKKRKGRGI